MLETFIPNSEKESYQGLPTLKLAQKVIGRKRLIKSINLGAYYNTPHIHTDKDHFTIEIQKEDFLKIEQEDLDRLAERCGEGWNINLNSNVILINGDIGHLIIVDLAPRKSQESLELIKNRFCEIIKPQYGGGFFLETKESYHYLGESIIGKDEWWGLLGDVLLTSIVKDMPEGIPDVHKILGDYRYVGHALKRKYSVMRLTTKGTKTFFPHVVDFI